VSERPVSLGGNATSRRGRSLKRHLRRLASTLGACACEGRLPTRVGGEAAVARPPRGRAEFSVLSFPAGRGVWYHDRAVTASLSLPGLAPKTATPLRRQSYAYLKTRPEGEHLSASRLPRSLVLHGTPTRGTPGPPPLPPTPPPHNGNYPPRPPRAPPPPFPRSARRPPPPPLHPSPTQSTARVRPRCA
jgi:hypothetical protein